MVRYHITWFRLSIPDYSRLEIQKRR